MQLRHLLLAALLIFCLAVSPAAAADWVPPTDRSIVGVEWNASDPSPALRWIDVDGNTITPPDFNTHVIWGNVKKVLLTDDEVVIRDINPRGDNLDMSGASGKVMTEIPKFYVASMNASTDQYRYYRWWISPDPADGFELHPAFVQRGGIERDNIYVGSYEATLRVLGDGTLALDSRSGEQPWTGYGGSNPKDGMFKIAFDAGTTAPAIGATVTGSTSNTAGQVVDLYVSSGSWANSDAAGFLILKQSTGTFTNDEPLKTGGTAFATADTPNGNAGIRATINDFEAAGEALGGGYGAMNVWTYSAIRMLHLIEYANWGSQETVGLGIVSKASGTGFAGEVTGFNSVDTNVNEYGTGTGTGTAGLTPASYRTMTDLWGNLWEWVTGYTSTNTEYQITKRDGTGSLSTHPLAAGSYESSEATPLGAGGRVQGYWTSLFHEDLLQYLFIANSVTGGSASTYGTDYQYSHEPGTRVLLAGGGWDYGRGAGLGYLDSFYTASSSVRYRGARLEFIGAATLHGAAPVAQFTQNATAGNAPFAVAFTDTSTGTPDWWRWDFGDGNTSTDQSPTYTYTEPGTYNVTLTAYTIYGENTSTTETVTVEAPPAASFSTNTAEGNAPLDVAFTDLSTGNVTAWAWDFGDSQTSTDRNATHTYTAPGTYSVTLNASNAYGYNISAATAISVLDPPVANFSANATVIPTGSAVAFTDLSTGNVTAWAWDFGDGNTSTDRNATHTYAAPGLYSVTLNASNAYGYNLTTFENYIDVGNPPAAGFSANATVGGLPFAVAFTDESANAPTAWNWTFGDGSFSEDQHPVHVYAAPGLYSVTLNASNAYGYNLTTFENYIDVGNPPAAGFSANATVGGLPFAVAFTDESANAPTAWNWTFGDGSFSEDQHPVHVYAAPGLYTVILTATNQYGSNQTARTAYIDVGHPPAANFTPSATIGVVPAVISFTDTSANTPTAWLWDFGDGNNSTHQNPSHTYVTAGTYTVALTVSNAYGEDTKTALLTVYDPVTANFTADTAAGLVPLAVTFTDASTGTPTAWNWTFGDGNTSTLQNPAHTYAAEGNYTVTLIATNEYGSDEEIRTDYITVYAPVTAQFTADVTSGAAPLTVQFTDTSTGSPTSWLWTFGDGNTSTAQNPQHTYSSAGTYTVTLTASHTYSNDTETKTSYISVVVLRPRASATIPTLSTDLKDDLINSLGGETVPEPGEDTINWTGLISTIGGAYTSILGPLAYTLIFSIPFLMMWITQRDMTLPGLVGALFGLFIIVRLPAEFHLVAVTFIVISIVAVIYSLVKERV